MRNMTVFSELNHNCKDNNNQMGKIKWNLAKRKKK